MPAVIAKMTSEELAEWQDIQQWIDAARMSVNDLTLEQGYNLSRRETEFMARLRERYEIEDGERVTFDIITGAITEDE